MSTFYSQMVNFSTIFLLCTQLFYVHNYFIIFMYTIEFGQNVKAMAHILPPDHLFTCQSILGLNNI